MFITKALNHVRLLTRLNVVDNSEIGRRAKEAGKKVKVIHCYTQGGRYKLGTTGDKVLVTILGEMRKGILVGCVATQRPFVPKFDSNNVVLIDDNNVPIGTRVTAPIPNYIRKQGALTARLMAICTRFV